MKRLALLLAVAGLSACAADLTNTVVTVDQRGNLNVEGVATVSNVAANAVKTQIAEAKAEAAQETARGVTSAISAVVENIMSNNVVIYRSGFSDSFASLVIFTDNDILAITDARWREQSAASIVVELDYVTTINLGSIKPAVMHSDTLGIGRGDFAELDAENVSAPVYHAESRTYDGQTFAGYYTITATIPNPSGHSSYFLWVRVDGDIPSGDGMTLDLPNGVTGGMTGEYTWGDKVLTFRGGGLRGVRNVD